MTVYKIVSPSLKSLYHLHFKSFAIQYKVGEFVFPSIGKIFAFDSLKNAKKIAVHHSCQIWEAETTKIYPHIEYRLNIWDINDVNMRQFWNLPRQMLDTVDSHCIGTVLCDDLKLIKQIT